MGLVRYPNEQDFKGMVRANMIPNCPIDANDIAYARDIWGPNLASLRGKAVPRTPAPVVAEYVAVPKSMID